MGETGKETNHELALVERPWTRFRGNSAQQVQDPGDGEGTPDQGEPKKTGFEMAIARWRHRHAMGGGSQATSFSMEGREK